MEKGGEGWRRVEKGGEGFLTCHVPCACRMGQSSVCRV